MPDFSKFKGALPYASELLGVYQPILGWESRMVKVRAAREVAARTSALMRELMRDSRMSPFTDGRLWVLDAPTLPALAGGPSNRLTSLVAERATALRGPAGGLTPPQWESLLSPEALQALLRQSIAEL